MAKKKMLLGDEAIAVAAVNAGIAGVYSYPGTPSTEITEYIQSMPLARERKIHSDWCTNEKTAMEAALGVSYIGKRSLVCMKHVGMNVCADPFVNSVIAGANGGVIVVAADDPSMHSSQDEQDSRFFAQFAFAPVLEPSSQQEAHDMVKYGYELSEKYHTTVLLRVTTRMAHSRAVVEIADEAEPIAPIKYPENPASWVLLPANSRRQYPVVLEHYAQMEKEGESAGWNRYFEGKDKSFGIIACGIGYNYVRENVGEDSPWPILKISQYPVPKSMIRRMAQECGTVLVVEEGQPLLEEQIRGILPTACVVKGRLSGELPRTGELTPDCVRAALGMPAFDTYQPSAIVVPRPPALCQGCGHRSVYEALNDVLRDYPSSKVFSDIGCYTLGYLPPFRAIHSTIDMGASITMAKGAADCGQYPAVAVIGDSTFTHSGMTGLLDAVNANADIVVIISDNLTTGMTGGQDSAGTGRIESICRGIGVDPDHLKVVVPLPKNMDEIRRTIKEEIEYHGLSVIIPRRECIQTARRHAKEKKNA